MGTHERAGLARLRASDVLPPLIEPRLGVMAHAQGVIEGYASLFGSEDLSHDIVSPGAFAETLRLRGARGIKMLLQHNSAEPIGVWDDIRETPRGLYARGRVLLDVGRGRDAFALMRAGALDGLSIGFKAVRARRDAARGVRRLEKIDLWEISVVTFPMQPEARVTDVRMCAAEAGGALESAALRRAALRIMPTKSQQRSSR